MSSVGWAGFDYTCWDEVWYSRTGRVGTVTHCS